MDARPQDTHWPSDGVGGPLRREHHYGGCAMRCFSQRPLHLDAMFRDVVARCGEREALVAGELRLDYRALDERVDRLAVHLAQRGVGPGERVALLLGNEPEFLVTVLACARLGAVSVPMGTRQARPEVEHVLNDCGAMALVFGAEFCDSVPPPAATPALRLRLAVGGAVAEAEPFGGLQEPIAAATPAPVIDEEQTAVLLYTSGTTGRPKGAMLTHLGIVHSLIHFVRCFELRERERERTLLAVPASHVTGLVSLLLTTVFVGGCSIFLRAFKARDFLALAERERMTYTLMVPAMYLLCLREPALAEVDLRAWRVGGFGGSPMPEAAIAALAQRLPGLTLHNAYGATETSSPTTLMPRGEALNHPDSVGQVVPCGDVLVVDESGAEVPPGTPGELLIGGPMVVPGYWRNPDADARNFVDGRWRSGDVGSIDANGFVRVFDRLKDMINRGGYKIFSAEVENVLSSHPQVLECAVVAEPDPVLGERVKAFVVVDGDGVTAEGVRAHCAQHLADYKVPELVALRLEPLPRNANGKVQKTRLRAPA